MNGSGDLQGKWVHSGMKGEWSLSNRYRARVWVALFALLTVLACTDAVPTSDNPDLISIYAETTEIRLPLSVVTSGIQTFSGYGSPGELRKIDGAHEWDGVLESRVLLRFGSLPASILVLPPGSDTAQPDSAYVPVSGTVVVRIDPLTVLGSPTFEAELSAVETEWDYASANWELAVDTLGGSEPWPEPGAGPARFLSRTNWSPVMGDSGTVDSLTFSVDGATIQEWVDTTLVGRTARIDAVTSGSRFRLLATASLMVQAESTINPDTLVEVQAELTHFAAIQTPSPEATPGVIQLGGAPARRAVFELQLPEALELSSAEMCTRTECPGTPEAGSLVYASLVLHSHPTASPGLHPIDTHFVELREVLSPERLPRSPLSAPVQEISDPLAPELFSSESQSRYEVPMTEFLRDVLEADSLGVARPTLALLVSPEPSSIEVLSFYGPGTELEPYLRLIWTVSDEVGLP